MQFFSKWRGTGLVIAALIAVAFVCMVRPVDPLPHLVTKYRPQLAAIAGLGAAFALTLEAARWWRRLRHHLQWSHATCFMVVSIAAMTTMLLTIWGADQVGTASV